MKNSLLNKFRVGCTQQSGSLFLEWTINLDKDYQAKDPSLGLIFLWETRDQPQPGSPLSRFLGREEERPWERGCHLLEILTILDQRSAVSLTH